MFEGVIGIVLCVIAEAVVISYGICEYKKSRKPSVLMKEEAKFFRLMKEFDMEEEQMMEMYSSFSSLEELKKANKRFSKLLKIEL